MRDGSAPLPNHAQANLQKATRSGLNFGLNFGFRRRLPLILQSETAECGLACLAMVAGWHGYDTDLLSLRQRFALSLRGANLKHVIEIASALNLSSRPLRIELDDLPHMPMPCILHWNMNHFVVLKSAVVGRDGQLTNILIHDPVAGERRLSRTEVSQAFTGIALELLPTERFERKQNKQSINFASMVGKVRGLWSTMAHILMLALALELFALAAPFFMQWVVDAAVLSADHSLLNMLAVGFGLLLIIQTALSLFRSWMVLYASTHLNLQWMNNVLTHLLHLPMHYFEKRHLGDVVSRFNAVQVIQRTLSTSFIEAILDGLLAVTALSMLLLYNAGLTLVVLSSVTAYGLLRVALYRPLRHATEEQISLSAREQSLFFESIRGIQTIKLFNHEDVRRARWLNALAAAVNRGITTQKMMLGFNTGHTLIAGVENLIIIWLGARLAMENVFSVGMLYAFIAYKTTFTTRLYALIDKWQEFRMLSLQGERLADIVLSAPEETGTSDTPHFAIRKSDNLDIEVRNLSFRYSEHEPWILHNLNLTITAGESVALVGPSGCGKTTLLKLMLGLLEPTSGDILIGGISLRQLGLRNYRDLIAAVMQDDQLLSGSILDNLCFFDSQPDMARIEQVAQMAAIASDIERMPMGYQTLIGDMGSSLSGGQKQRLLLARALYKQPRILFLDEATSHLDVERERLIGNAIQTMALTRIMVAHRPEAIRQAGRVIELCNVKN